MKRMFRTICMLLVIAILSGCAPITTQPNIPEETPHADVPENTPVYTVSPEESLSEEEKSELYAVLNAIDFMLFDKSSLATNPMGVSIVFDAATLIYYYDNEYRDVSTDAVIQAVEEWMNDQDETRRKSNADKIAGAFLAYKYMYEAAYNHYEQWDSALLEEMEALTDVERKRWHDYPSNAAQGIFYVANQIMPIDGFAEYAEENYPHLQNVARVTPEPTPEPTPELSGTARMDAVMLEKHLADISNNHISSNWYADGAEMSSLYVAAFLVDWASGIKLSTDECRQLTRAWLVEQDMDIYLLKDYCQSMSLVYNAYWELSEFDVAEMEDAISRYGLPAKRYPWSQEGMDKVYTIIEEIARYFYEGYATEKELDVVDYDMANIPQKLVDIVVNADGMMSNYSDEKDRIQEAVGELHAYHVDLESGYLYWCIQPAGTEQVIDRAMDTWFGRAQNQDCTVLVKVLNAYWMRFAAENAYHEENDPAMTEMIEAMGEVYVDKNYPLYKVTHFLAWELTERLESIGYRVNDLNEIFAMAQLKAEGIEKEKKKEEERELAAELAQKPMYVVKCETNVSLRGVPSKEAYVVAEIPFGEEVTYCEDSINGFYKVQWRGYEGYVLSEYLANEPERRPKPYDYLRVINNVYLQSHPREDSDVYKLIEAGDCVTLYDSGKNGYYYVTHEWNNGYISKDDLELIGMPEYHQQMKVSYSDETVCLMDSYNGTARAMCEIPIGAILYFEEFSYNGYVVAVYDDLIGYVKMRYLEIIK